MDVRAGSLWGEVAAATAPIAEHSPGAGPWPAGPAVWAAGTAAHSVACPRARLAVQGRLANYGCQQDVCYCRVTCSNTYLSPFACVASLLTLTRAHSASWHDIWCRLSLLLMIFLFFFSYSHRQGLTSDWLWQVALVWFSFLQFKKYRSLPVAWWWRGLLLHFTIAQLYQQTEICTTEMDVRKGWSGDLVQVNYSVRLNII